MKESIFISSVKSYIPQTPTDSPKLEYADPLFRRRLSQITKMTIQVVHDILEDVTIGEDTKLVFVSLRGEIKREFTINKWLIEDNSIMPAAFSLSVFNTPIASATLAFKLHGGYSVIYPSKNNFRDGFIQAVSPVLAETENEIIFVYADELVPEEYGDLRPAENIPMAFACKISNKADAGQNGNSIEIRRDDLKKISSSPSEFLEFLKNKN